MITTFDVRWACDVLRPAYDAQRRRRRPRVDRGRPAPRARDRAHRRRGPTAVVARGPAQPLHQDPGDQGRPAGDRAVHRRGHQHQRHADLLPRALPRGHGRLHQRHRAGACRRSRPQPARVGGVVLRQPGRHRGRQAAGEARLEGGRRAARQGRHRQRAAGVPGVRGGLRDRPLDRPGGGRGQAPAPAVGVHRRQGPVVRRHAVRRRAGRAAASSTPCRSPRWTRSPTTASSGATRSAASTARPPPRSRRSRRPASTWTTSSRCSRTRAWRSSRSPGTTCSPRRSPSCSGSRRKPRSRASASAPATTRGAATSPAWPPSWSPRTTPSGGRTRSPRRRCGSAGSTCRPARRRCSPGCARSVSGSRRRAWTTSSWPAWAARRSRPRSSPAAPAPT